MIALAAFTSKIVEQVLRMVEHVLLQLNAPEEPLPWDHPSAGTKDEEGEHTARHG